ncbi:hypothetical protein DY218_23100 [Streptomyces triticagri]|uniref:Extensin n=1 Tax=Streptomyces triticagri TaxID=2293568 RepID=A0A372M0E1_9ACTN|nr:hypothetical protein [Streptomyces triticagri]RFU84351.1 hypothetical protein DY218_23100 [Streptomyces triticagri]
MADERFKWLDEDAAEQLLRGEPLDAVDDDAHARAGRLQAVLGAAKAAHHPQHEELPGEEAALAAFRAAMGAGAGAGRTGAPVRTGSGVHIAGGRGRSSTRWGRPVRFGLAATLAVCTLGGVAVAAGTGVIPTPFGGRSEPGPAASVSAVATPPDPLSSPSADPSEPGIAGSGSPDPDGGPKDDDDPATGDGGHPSQGDPDSPTEQDGGDKPSTGGDKDHRPPGGWYEQAIDACRDHREGRPLAPGIQRRLEKAAKNASDVKRFCDRLLDRQGQGGGESGDGKGDYDGGDGGDGDDNESGGPSEPDDPSPSNAPAPDPPAGFAPPPATETPEPSASGSAAAGSTA